MAEAKQTDIQQPENDSRGFVRKSNIQSQIAWSMVFILAATFVVVTLMIFFLGRYGVGKYIGVHFQVSAQALAESFHRNVNARAGYYDEVSKHIGSLIRSNAGDASYRRMFTRLIEQYPDIEGLMLIGENGNVVSYNHWSRTKKEMNWGNVLAQNYKDREWFAVCTSTLLGKFYKGTPGINVSDTDLQQAGYMWAYGVDQAGGCLVVLQNLTLLTDTVYNNMIQKRKLLKSQTVHMHMVTPDGDLIWSSDDRWKIFSKENDNKTPVNSLLSVNNTGVEYFKYEGDRSIVAWSSLSDHLGLNEVLYFDGKVVVQESASVIGDLVNPLIFYILFAGIGITILAAIWVYNKNKKIIQDPLINIEHILEEVSTGNLFIDHIDLPDHGDIGYVSFGLNKMINKIRNLIIILHQNGRLVVKEGKKFFASLGAIQSASNKQINLIVKTFDTIQELKVISEDIQSSASKQLEAAGANKVAMEKLQDSFDESANRRSEITVNTKNVVEKSNEGVQAIDEFVETVQTISDASQKIKSIITVIDDISDQTNLLALNASIEAARAGEHGKGFSVVAREVSDLAKKSNQSASEIATLIKDTVSQIATVTEKINHAKGFFTHIVDQMKILDKDVIEMANFTQKQQIATEETAERAKNVSAYAQNISEKIVVQLEKVDSINETLVKTREFTTFNSNEVEHIDELLQNLMDKIYTLLESANDFHVIADDHPENIEKEVKTDTDVAGNGEDSDSNQENKALAR